MSKAGWYILGSLVLMVPMAAFLARSRDVSAGQRQTAAQVLVFPDECQPEPGERAAFLACAAGFPLLIFGFAAIDRKFGSNHPERGEVSSRDDWLSLMFLAIAVDLAWVGLRAEGYHSLLMNGFFRGPPQSAVLFAVTLGLMGWGHRRGASVKHVAGAFAFAVILVAASVRIFDDRAKEALSGHFEPVYHPLVQVMLGKTVLVDMTSQYGLFPHFLAPIFAVVGVSVLKFTIVIAVLVAAVLAVLWAFLRGATQNRMVAVLGLAAVIVNSSYPLIETNDLYFQYMPIRMVAPVASLWLTWRYLVRPSRGRYWATMFALGAGPLWNLDSGLPALASWLGVLAYGELGTVGTRTRTKLSRIAGHLGAGGLGMSTAVLAYSVLALARSGHRPDFAAFLEFQRTFYVTGFYMLPMPATGGWWAVALVYLAGLAYAARALATDRVTPRSAILFHLATLGIGLFSYYQGRSHPRVLSLVWWPAVVILTLFLDDLIADWGQAPSRISRIAAAAVLTWVIGGSAWSLSEQGPFLKNWYENHLLATRNKGQSVIAPDIAMLRRSLARGERTLVIFEHESHLSNRLHRRSFWRSSLIESLLVKDFRVMRRRIERGEFDRILVSRNSVNESNTRHRGLILMGDIFRNAAVVDQSPNSVLLRPKIIGM